MTAKEAIKLIEYAKKNYNDRGNWEIYFDLNAKSLSGFPISWVVDYDETFCYLRKGRDEEKQMTEWVVPLTVITHISRVLQDVDNYVYKKDKEK